MDVKPEKIEELDTNIKTEIQEITNEKVDEINIYNNELNKKFNHASVFNNINCGK